MNDRTQSQLKHLTLEMSLKPFKRIDDQYVVDKIEELLRLWHYLIIRAESLQFLLWIADGSEILEWTGDETDVMEWARYIGFANIDHLSNAAETSKAKFYTPDPPEITYADLRRIVRLINQATRDRYGLEPHVGATFDPGPEFAYSRFKYADHPEVNKAPLADGFITLESDYEVVCPWAVLKGDDTRYAAFPEGIPDGLDFGTFFGKQAEAFLTRLGFDYIWLSNGFGYSFFPWTYQGANFDGKSFGLGEYADLSNRILGFWEKFKEHCPYPVEVRGSNFSTGMEIAKDCIPVKEFYDRGFLQMPAPNSPWGYIDNDFGLELGGFLTRISKTPSRDFPFRFYLDDPWFWQICWKHGFERRPHEIYNPLSIARIGEDGTMEPPNVVDILSVDGETGEFDEQNTLEMIPHLRSALDRLPDEPGILTLLYPFSEHHRFAASTPDSFPRIFFNDWIVCNAINSALPLNTVVNSDVFRERIDDPIFRRTILLIPTGPFDGSYIEKVCGFIRGGGRAIFFGPVRSPALRQLLNIAGADNTATGPSDGLSGDGDGPSERTTGLAGEFELLPSIETDTFEHGGNITRMRHEALVSSGGISERLADSNDCHTRICAVVRRGIEERVYALTRQDPAWNGGMAGWVRGTLPLDTSEMRKLPKRYPPEYTDGSLLLRWILGEFGYGLYQKRFENSVQPGLMTVCRNRNAFLFNGYKFDASVTSILEFPDGAPLMQASSAKVRGGRAEYVFEKVFRYECRLFVRQEQEGVVTCRHAALMAPTKLKSKTESYEVHGLRDARLTLYPPLYALQGGLVEVRVREDRYSPYRTVEFEYAPADEKIVTGPLTGQVEVSW